MRATKAQVAAAFEQWKADYDADPDGFESHEDFKRCPPKTYGESAARILNRYIKEQTHA